MRYHRIYRVMANERMVRNNIFISMTSNKVVKIQVQLPEDLRTRFKSKCVLGGTTMNEVLVKLMEDWTEEEPKKSKPQE
jgi:hypothetical protein